MSNVKNLFVALLFVISFSVISIPHDNDTLGSAFHDNDNIGSADNDNIC